MQNLQQTCYNLIDQNLEKFNDLRQYDIDHSQNINNIISYVDSQTCCRGYFDFVKSMLEAVQYVSCDTFIQILDLNMNEIVKLVNTESYEPVLITTDDGLQKSNIFYSLYMLKHLRDKGIVINHIYSSIKSTSDPPDLSKNLLDKNGNIKIPEIPLGKKVLLILCDDISYSGTQLATHINASPFGVPSFYPKYNLLNKIVLEPRVKIFLNVVGLLPPANDLINSQFTDLSNLIIPTSVIRFNGNLSVDDIINLKARELGLTINQYKKLNDCWVLLRAGETIKLESKFSAENFFYSEDYTRLSLIYPFQKYPDALSTYSKLCYIKAFNGMLTLNVENFLREFNITTDTFCRNISNNISLNEFMCDCGIENYNSIVSNIILNYDNQEVISGINWLNGCGISKNDNIFSNEFGNWFKSMNNFPSDLTFLNRFKGNCYNQNVIKSFYKEISLVFNGTTYNKTGGVVTLSTLDNLRVLNQKYLKYKNKYLSIKNKKN